jgi:hypothetical protein
MLQSELGNVPDAPNAPQAPKRVLPAAGAGVAPAPLWRVGQKVVDWLNDWNKVENKPVDNSTKKKSQRALLIDFGFDEGMYLDSKTVTFHASWRLVTTFSHILLASGLWTKVDEKGKVLWATTLAEVSGSQSWLPNKARPDVIVDLGGG